MRNAVLLVLCVAVAVGVWAWRLQPAPKVQPSAEMLAQMEKFRDEQAHPRRTETLQVMEVERREHEDDYQRCLAYPDLPGSAWPPGSVFARCDMLRPVRITVDEVAAALPLRAKREKLDFRFEQLHGVAVTNQNDIESHLVYQALSAPEAAATVDAWVKAAPDSRFARLAAGVRHAAAAERARGTRWIKDTPPEAIEGMRAEAALAKPHLLHVLDTDPDLSPACTWSTRLGRIAGDDELLERGLRACSAAAPASFWFVREMYRLADPVWGGNPEALAQVAAYVRTHQESNPLLATLAVEPEYQERYRISGGGDPASIDLYRRWARATADPYVLKFAGEGLLESARINGDSELVWEAIGILTQVIRFAPVEDRPYYARAIALAEQGQPALAAADFARLLPEQPLDFTLIRFRQRALAAAEGGEPFEPSGDDWMNERRICAETIAARDAETEACSQALIDQDPDDPYAWWLRADALAAAGDRDGERAALARFEELAVAGDPSLDVLVPRARERLAD